MAAMGFLPHDTIFPELREYSSAVLNRVGKKEPTSLLPSLIKGTSFLFYAQPGFALKNLELKYKSRVKSGR